MSFKDSRVHIQGGINLPAPITPFTTSDTYPTHFASFGKGGLRTVQEKDDLDKIPDARKELGMWVYVINDPDGIHNYQLQNIDTFTETITQVPKIDEDGNPVYKEDGVTQETEEHVEKTLQNREIKWVPMNLGGGGNS